MDEPVLWCKDLRKRFKERLATFAAVLLALATWRLRKALVG
jgi:hypothetical protein